MRARTLLFATVAVLVVAVCAQLPRRNTYSVPYTGNSYSVDYSSEYYTTYSRPSAPVQLTVQSQQVPNKNPTFEFLNPSGLRITIPGPYPQSPVYYTKFHVNINHDFNGVKRGEWDEDVNIPSGRPWSHTFPAIRLRQADTIYYWIEIVGKQGLGTWFREYKGFYQVPLPNPHSSQNPDLSLVHQPQESGVSSSNLDPSVFFVNQPKPPTDPNTHGSQPVWTTMIEPKPPPSPVAPVVPSNNVNPSIFYQNPSSDKDDKVSECRPSPSTVFNNGKRPCAGESFVDRFHFDSVEQIGSEPEDSFTVFSKDNTIRKDTVYRTSTHTLIPSLLEDRYGPKAVDKSITLPDCTSKRPELCSAKAMGYIILPPVISGRETTEYSLTFCYGVLEVTAKLPKGDWIVPELWLVPRNSNSAGRIVLAKSRGNAELTDGVKDYSNRVLEAGIEYGNGKETMFKKVQGRPWSDSYHKFKLVWTQDLMQFYVDDQEIGHAHFDATSRSKLQPFDQECYLVFGVHVGGDKDFPDNLVGKPWENKGQKNILNFWQDRSKWQRTWTDERSLIISGISLTALSE